MPANDTEKSRWGKVKDSISKTVHQAKAKLGELKAEMENKKEKPAKFQYGAVNSPRNVSPSSHSIFSKKECPFCNSPIPVELLTLLAKEHKIVCEHCGSLIKL